ncbi:MAG TPA: T9SS type A sorting domain-containing protein [Cryomorphaceae bacterium]|nr:T9SS type A sorting domain-containing protein [Cryomorphaceae bacterium]
MKTSLTAIAAICFLTSEAQYSSPNSSLTLSLQDLVEESNGAVQFSDDTYEIYENITISETDTLVVESEMVVLDEGVLITIAGGFLCTSSSFSQLNCCDAHYEGFRFEETAVADIFNTLILYGGGIQVLTGDFRLEASTVSYHNTGQTTGAAVDLSTGKPEIINCTFLQNEVAAIGSAANSDAAPLITGCTFNGNVTDNSNRPQINLGPSGTDTTFVTQNIIQGDPSLTNVGGMAFSLLVGGEGHLVFSGNEVFDNRYGMTVFGANVTSRITDNAFLDNDTQQEPFLGGSGISITGFGENNHLILNNVFVGNLWGITLITDAKANLGETDNPDIGPGGNFFNNNGNEGALYALFNNTENTIFAQGNCWDSSDDDLTLAEAELVISHVMDDPELGEVIFDPLGTCSGLSATTTKGIEMNLFPNPSSGKVNFTSQALIESIEVIDLKGRKVFQQTEFSSAVSQIDLSALPSGFYLVKVETIEGVFTEKLCISL